MNVHTQRLIDRFVGQFACRFIDVLSLFSFKRKRAVTPEKIGIVLLSEMGSLTMIFPMIQLLGKRYCQSELSIITFERNREIIEIMDLVPKGNIVTIDDTSLTRFLFTSCRAISTLRDWPVDTIIDCELFARASSIFSYLSGAGNRAGFHPHTQEGLYRGNHINNRVLYNPYVHISRQFINLADSLECKEEPRNKNKINSTATDIVTATALNTDTDTDTDNNNTDYNNNLIIPGIKISQAEKETFKQRIHYCFPEFLDRQIVVINPGGGMLPIRAWPEAYYCEVAQKIVMAGFSVAVTGVLEDKTTGENITAFCETKYCVNMVGFTRSVYELLILFSLSRLFITNDGGPGHFSCLTATPGIILFGPETPVLYGSLNPNAINMQAGVACSPCLTAYNHRNSPCNGNNVCLKSITPETVLNKAFELLS